MRDTDLRNAVHASLVKAHTNDVDVFRIVHELDLCGLARVDVAVINGSLIGYELKSPADSLRRLPNQIEMYSKVLDYSTLVVAREHLSQARDLLPRWWGLTEARWTDDGVQLRAWRRARKNPRPDPLSVALLLWKAEAFEALEERGLGRGSRSMTRRQVCASLASAVPLHDLQELVRERLKGRQDWRVAQ